MIVEIREVFRESPDKVFTVSDLSELLDFKKDGIRSSVHRLYVNGYVERVSTGHYKFKKYGTIDKEDMISSPIGLHRIVLKRNVTSTNPCYMKILRSYPLVKSGNEDTYIMNLSGLTVRINISSKSITVRLSCNNSKLHPFLLPSEIIIIQDILDHLFSLGFEEEPDQWELLTFDMNRDFLGYRLDGASALTYQHVKGLLFKAYNKGSALRVETSCSLPIRFSELATWLKGGPVPGIPELLNEIKKIRSDYAKIEARVKKQSTRQAPSPHEPGRSKRFEKHLMVFESLTCAEDPYFTLAELDKHIKKLIGLHQSTIKTHHEALMPFVEPSFTDERPIKYGWNKLSFYKFYNVHHPIYNNRMENENDEKANQDHEGRKV